MRKLYQDNEDQNALLRIAKAAVLEDIKSTFIRANIL